MAELLRRSSIKHVHERCFLVEPRIKLLFEGHTLGSDPLFLNLRLLAELIKEVSPIISLLEGFLFVLWGLHWENLLAFALFQQLSVD
jgi:hypothetical protein